MTILDRLQLYESKNPQRFHTPGHKGTLDGLDITELEDFFPSDLIENAQRTAAEFYGARHLRFLTNGSSIGIKAAILASEGDILTGENYHQSVREATVLAKTRLITIKNEVREGLPTPLTKEQIDRAIKQNPSVKAVVVQTPDYFGQTSSIDIVDVVKSHKKILICDSAHGAHFSADKKLFPLSFSEYADFVNLSAHKTMSALTQTAYLCINDDSLLQRADYWLENLGTTSPSYLLLSSLEQAIIHIKQHKNHYNNLYKEVNEFKARIKCLKNDDYTRLVVDAEFYGLSGERLYKKLFEKNIVAEKFTDRYVVFIITLCDSKDSIKMLAENILRVV